MGKWGTSLLIIKSKHPYEQEMKGRKIPRHDHKVILISTIHMIYKLSLKEHLIYHYVTCSCDHCCLKNHKLFLELSFVDSTFLMMFRTGSTMLRASTVPQVTLGNKGVNAK